MSNPEWEKKKPGVAPYEGPRAADLGDLYGYDDDTLSKIQTILDSMEWPELIVFQYDGSQRVVAPFVVGISGGGNPLLRGYQLGGISMSGKGEGWRVFQIRKMENVESYQEFFSKDDFDFDEFYPWTYKVFKML